MTLVKELEDSLEKTISVFEYDKENNKYKLVQKELNILKPGENDAGKTKLKTNKFNPNVIVE